MKRREFIGTAAAALAAAGASALPGDRSEAARDRLDKMKLGLVTYNLAADWDVDTIIRRCAETGFEGVELRTTHAHGVEPSLSAAARSEVRKKFADSPVRLWGLGSVCEFHSPDPSVVKSNIETAKQFCQLARDVGAAGVKVRPNGLADGVPEDKTLEQIGKALAACGGAARDAGVEIWLEVHGNKTAEPARIRKIMDHCSHPSVGVCWNSNPGEPVGGSIRKPFDLLKRDIKSCHITELTNDYPWRELFLLLKKQSYSRFTLMEAPALASHDEGDILRFMRYYRRLWETLSA